MVIAILPGDFCHMRFDVHRLEGYGVRQPVGDVTGPGGLLRALRTVPMFAETALAALLNDPRTSRADPLDAQRMPGEMIGNTAGILPEGWRRHGLIS